MGISLCVSYVDCWKSSRKQQKSALEFRTWLNSTSATIPEKTREKEKGELTHIIQTAFLLVFDIFREQMGQIFESTMGCSLWRQEAAVCLRLLVSETGVNNQELDCAMSFSRIGPSILRCLVLVLHIKARCLWQYHCPFPSLSQVLLLKQPLPTSPLLLRRM